jgi:hypothetical protein
MTRLPASKLPVPLESEEGETLVAYLRLRGIAFTHVPNTTGGSPEARRRAITMKRQGTSRGFPDYVIALPGIGIAFVELKRQRGGAVAVEQLEWVDTLNLCPGAEARVCKGAQEAIAFIEELAPSTIKEER